MPVAEQCDQQPVDKMLLADDDACHLLPQGVYPGRVLGDGLARSARFGSRYQRGHTLLLNGALGRLVLRVQGLLADRRRSFLIHLAQVLLIIAIARQAEASSTSLGGPARASRTPSGAASEARHRRAVSSTKDSGSPAASRPKNQLEDRFLFSINDYTVDLWLLETGHSTGGSVRPRGSRRP